MLLYFNCVLTICIQCLFLTMQWVGLQSVIVAFSCHTQMLLAIILLRKKVLFALLEVCSCCRAAVLFSVSLMPRSHIRGSPRRFHYGSNPTDDPGNDNFYSLIRMHNASTTTYDYGCNTEI